MVSFYNILLDIKCFVKKNLGFIIFLNVVLLIFAVLGCVAAVNTDCLEAYENSDTDIFIYIKKESNAFVSGLFVYTVLVFALLVLAKVNFLVQKLSFIFICIRLYNLFNSCCMVLACLGIKMLIPVLIFCVLQIACNLLLVALYVYNFNDDRVLREIWQDKGYISFICCLIGISIILNVLSWLILSVFRIIA